MSIWDFLTGTPADRLQHEANNSLTNSQRALHDTLDINHICDNLRIEIIKRSAIKRSVKKMPKGIVALATYLAKNNLLTSQPPSPTVNQSGIAAHGEIKQWARSIEYLLQNIDEVVELLAETGSAVVYQLLQSLSNETINHGSEGYKVPLYSMVGNFHDTSQGIIEELMAGNDRSQKLCGLALFPDLDATMQENIKRVSGLSIHEDLNNTSPTLPLSMKNKTAGEIVDLYFARTEIHRALNQNVRFEINKETRLSHTHILAGSGWGKTQLLQNMIADDLERRQKETLSIILLDSEGGIIENVLRHPCFAPNHPSGLFDKLRIIDPAKPNGVPGFNVFNMAGHVANMSAADRDKAINNAASIVSYSLNALAGTPLTGNQDNLLYEVVRLLHYAPGANWNLALDCLRDEDLAMKIALLAPERVRKFFENEYRTIYKDRRGELSSKLSGLVRSETVTNMLQDRSDRFDILKSIDNGEIIIIKADKNHLGSEMATFFGRLMIAMVHQAILPRSQKSSTPCYFYIDEAWEYIGDKRLTFFYAEARKRGMGLVLAHHTFAQAGSTDLRKTIETSTAIKIAGRGSREDAKVMTGYMNNADPEMILNLKKVDWSFSEFLVHVRDQTDNAPVVVRVPHGTLERDTERLPRQAEKPWPKQIKITQKNQTSSLPSGFSRF